MATAMTKPEEDIRLKMLNAFMTCPHRDTEGIKGIHKTLQEKDPLFYAHLGSWYYKHGDLRNHNEVFASLLSTDPYIDNREVGLALFREHAVFMKRKILGFIEGKKVKIREKTGKKIKVGKKTVDEVKITQKFVGLGKTPPTSFRKERERYLRWLEASPEKFDAVAMRNFNDLKALYASGRNGVKPGTRAQQILFEGKYPEDSKLNIFKKITEAKKPDEQAKMIVENKIPYTIAVGLIEKVTPSVLVALVNAMSPQELINNIASLQEKGAFDNPDLKKMIEAKLEKAKTSKNVATLKSKVAVDTNRVKDEGIIDKLNQVADTQVKKGGAIKIPTAIFVDRSGSMEEAIKVGKKLAAMVSGAMEADLHVVAFDNSAAEVVATDKTMTSWEKAFAPIRANGGTSIGCALDFLIRKKVVTEQIVVITDEDENAAPYFHEVFPKYEKTMGVTPHVVVINVNDKDGRAFGVNHKFTTLLKTAGITYDVYKPEKADYYGLPGLIPMLARKSKLDLVYEVMDTPLLVRKEYK